MGLTRRKGALAAAMLLGALLAYARHKGFPGGRSAPPAPAPAAAPVPLPLPKAKRASPPRKLAAKPAAPAKVRGAGLRDAGEAFGGRPPVRVDASTPTAQ